MRRRHESKTSTKDTMDQEAIQLMCLFEGTSVRADVAMEMAQEELTPSYMADSGVRWANVLATNLSIQEFCNRYKVVRLEELCALGFDAIEASNPETGTEMVRIFGAEECKRCLFNTPDDAIALVGTSICRAMGLGVKELFNACAGCPRHAAHIIKSCGGASKALPFLTAFDLLDSGLRGASLLSMGINVVSMNQFMTSSATPDQIARLGIVPAVRMR
jgi:hypothetical protein